MRKVARHLAAGLILVALATSVHAQDKGQTKTEAKASLARMRGDGEPKDRCSTGAYLASGLYVTRVSGVTVLKPGDRIMRFANSDVSAHTTEGLQAMLRNTSPDASVPISVERSGKPVDLILSCTNARPITAAHIAGLELAANGKFDECVSAFQSAGLGTFGALWKAQCASVGKNSSRFLAQFVHDAMAMLVEDATYAPGMRDDVVRQLQTAEPTIAQGLGSAKFDELVELTRRWPGSEQAFDKATPDWELFRRNAEATLIAKLVDPDSARIEWPYGFLYGYWKPVLSKRVEGYWSCGLINARNRMGGYTGSTFFVSVLDRNGNVLFTDMGSASEQFDMVATQCSGSVKQLPSAPRALRAITPASSTPPATSSIADELKKLAELRASGVLTEEEFQAAKAKLLGGKP